MSDLSLTPIRLNECVISEHTEDTIFVRATLLAFSRRWPAEIQHSGKKFHHSHGVWIPDHEKQIYSKAAIYRRICDE